MEYFITDELECANSPASLSESHEKSKSFQPWGCDHNSIMARPATPRSDGPIMLPPFKTEETSTVLEPSTALVPSMVLEPSKVLGWPDGCWVVVSGGAGTTVVRKHGQLVIVNVVGAVTV